MKKIKLPRRNIASDTPPAMYNKASVDDRKNAFEAARALHSSFVFSSTAEGLDFWQSVYERLMQINNDGVLDDAPPSA